MEMQKIVILEYSTGEVYIKNYDPNAWEDDEEFLKEHGFRIKDCSWLITNDLTLNID